MKYWHQGTKLLKLLYPDWIWQIKTQEKKLYLSFDDGPHPEITPWVLDQLKQYDAKASFFCIGKNVQTFPNVYEQILTDNHRTGNHTMHHFNGWKTPSANYFDDVEQAGKLIASTLFRPPYGRLTRFQGKALIEAGYHIIMWSLLSGDFDTQLSPSKCWEIIENAYKPGSIIVFHDSEKAHPRLRYCLPKLLEKAAREGYTFESINIGSSNSVRLQ